MLEQVGLIGLIIILFSIYIFSKKKLILYFLYFLIYVSNFHYYPLGTVMVQIIIINLMLYNEKISNKKVSIIIPYYNEKKI